MADTALLYEALDDEAKARYRQLKREAENERRERERERRESDHRIFEGATRIGTSLMLGGGLFGGMVCLAGVEAGCIASSVSLMAGLVVIVCGGIMSA